MRELRERGSTDVSPRRLALSRASDVHGAARLADAQKSVPFPRSSRRRARPPMTRARTPSRATTNVARTAGDARDARASSTTSAVAVEDARETRWTHTRRVVTRRITIDAIVDATSVISRGTRDARGRPRARRHCATDRRRGHGGGRREKTRVVARARSVVRRRRVVPFESIARGIDSRAHPNPTAIRADRARARGSASASASAPCRSRAMR